jgi:ABC-type transport system involved in cytochrome c biogenesis permease component
MSESEKDWKEKWNRVQSRLNELSGVGNTKPDSICQFLVKAAQPILRRFDNPFFALEIRLLERIETSSKKTTAETWILLAFAFLVFAPGLNIYEKYFDKSNYAHDFGDLAIALMYLIHAVICMGATLWGTKRIFHREHNSGTLKDLLLLPYPPLSWVAQKSVLALYFLALSWIFALPFYAIIIFTGDFHWNALLKALLLPLWSGLVNIGYTLLFTSDYLNDPPRPDSQSSAPRPPWQEKSSVQSAIETTRVVLGLGFGFISFFGWIAWLHATTVGIEVFWRPIRFFDFFAPPILFWLILHGSFFIAAFVHAGAMLSPSFEARRHASAILWSALATTYYTGLGFYWTGLNPLYAWGALLAAPLAAMIFSSLTATAPTLPRDTINRQDELTQIESQKNSDKSKPNAYKPTKRLNLPQIFSPEREIAFFVKQWDNAVFIKDLRIHLRKLSLISNLLWCIVTCFGLLWLVQRFPLSGFGGMIGVVFMSVLRLFGAAAGKSAAAWKQEAQGVTLPLLLLSPLSSREIINGRFWAGLIAGSGELLYGVIFIIGLWYLFPSTTLSVAPAILAALPLPLLALVDASVCAPASLFSADKKAEDDIGTMGCVTYVLLIPCILLLLNGSALPLIARWSCSGMLFLFYSGITGTVYNSGIARLDNRRRLPRKSIIANENSTF